MIGNHFKKKFSKRPPPGIIVTTVEERLFENTIFTFGTAIPGAKPGAKHCSISASSGLSWLTPGT